MNRNAAQQSSSIKNPKSDTYRLSVFLTDCLSAGTLKGFKYFEFYLRGKEELLCRVYSESKTNLSRSGSNLDLTTRSISNLNLSKRASKLLFDDLSQAIPASPCDQELEKDPAKTAFLIAGYARYKRPYVWLRSTQSKLMQKISGNNTRDADSPIKLETISDWPTKEIRLWQIVEEILILAYSDSRYSEVLDNPFAIDHEYLNTLSIPHSFVLSAALINFLRKIYISQRKYSEKVLDDIKILQGRHTSEFRDLVRRKKILQN